MSPVTASSPASVTPTPWLNLAVASDRAYLPHLATTVTSAVLSSASDIARVFVLSADITDSVIAPLRASLRDVGLTTIELVSVQAEQVEAFHISQHVSHATYMRFYLSELLPDTIDHVLYLDCDTVVVDQLTELRGSLEQLLASNESSEPLLAAAWRESHSPHLREFGFTSNDYFNAGVILLNLVGIRREGLVKRFIDLATEHHGRLMWWDQDVLNLALQDRWISLPARFNMTADSAVSHPAIIHFSGSDKPWHFGCRHPEQSRYREFRRQTPFVPFHRSGLGRYLSRRATPKVWKRRKKTVRKLQRRTLKLVARVARRLFLARSRS